MEKRYRLAPLISERRIAAGVRRLASQVQRDYADKDPLLVGVLRGAFIFLADLVRELDMPLDVEFVAMQSYRGSMSTGRVEMTRDVGVPVKGRHVLVVEDIVDTGLTTGYLLEHLKVKGPASVKLCALLDKPARRLRQVPIDYLGFTVPDRFLVGYGLDMDQKYRQLPAIFAIEEATPGG